MARAKMTPEDKATILTALLRDLSRVPECEVRWQPDRPDYSRGVYQPRTIPGHYCYLFPSHLKPHALAHYGSHGTVRTPLARMEQWTRAWVDAHRSMIDPHNERG